MNDFWAVIAAAGKGTRFGGDTPKQFLPLDGKPVLCRTLDVFAKCGGLCGVTIVAPNEFTNFTKDLLKNYSFPSLVVVGGKTRQESVYFALKKTLELFKGVVLIHDAARPFVTAQKIDETAKAAHMHGAAVLVQKITDTVKVVEGDFVKNLPLRLYAAHTPQAFYIETILAAHEKARAENFETTDDCAVAENFGVLSFAIEDCPGNIKITEKTDLFTISNEGKVS